MKKTAAGGMLVRRERWGLSLRGWIVVAVVAVVGVLPAGRGTQDFLAKNSPVGGGILVIEGWLPDYALEKAVQVYRAGGYTTIVTTGVEIEKGFFLSEYKTEAELAGVRLRGLGIAEGELAVVPAPPEIRTDRTFESARAFERWWRVNAHGTDSVDIFTLGAHARRSHLLFARALGDSIHVGVISCEDRRYDPRAWWTTSSGFREVTSELIAYMYVRAKVWQ